MNIFPNRPKLSRPLLAGMASAFALAVAAPGPVQAQALDFDIKTYSPGITYSGLVITDINQDGVTDLLLGSRNTNRVEVWSYDAMSGGVTLTGTIGPFPNNVHDIAVGDVDNDNDLDVVVGLRFSGVYWSENLSNTSWSAAKFVDGSYSWRVILEDFDLDGNLDIFDGIDRFFAKMFYGNGAGTFTPGPVPAQTTPGTRALSFDAAYLDSDGRIDLLGVEEAGSGNLRAFLNQSSPGAPAWATDIAGNPNLGIFYPHEAPAFGDFDGNGFADKLIIDYISATNMAEIVLFEGGQGGNLVWQRRVVDSLPGVWGGAMAADADGDGHLDILVGGAGTSNDLVIYLGDGAGAFAKQVVTLGEGIGGLHALAVGDINQDGFPDIAGARNSPSPNGFEILLREPVEVAVDIKPGSCPNPLNRKARGVIPVAIASTPTFDATLIDPASVTLNGVSPLRWRTEDVATPYEPFTGRSDPDSCTTLGPDGLTDLIFHFDTPSVVATLDPMLEVGDSVTLQVSGQLLAGGGLVGEDVVKIVN